MSKRFEKHFNLRIMGSHGWLYFCRQCGDYLPENRFYKRRGTAWGYDSSCKLHKDKTNKEEYDPDMEYLKLNPLTENDFIGMRKFLNELGYCFNCNKTIHEQFMERHQKQFKKKS